MAFQKPIRPLHLHGVTPEKRLEMQEAFARLAEAVAPHVRPQFDARMAQVEKMAEIWPEELPRWLLALNAAAGVVLKVTSVVTFGMVKSPEEYLREQDELEFQHNCHHLVEVWLYLLTHSFSRDAYGVRHIYLQSLNEAMLPIGIPEETIDDCESSLGYTVLGMNDIIGILRDFRSTLPEGKRLPDDALIALTYDGRTVIEL